MSFSVGTKQSRPKLKIGALVHARVQRVNHLGEVALTCVEKSHDVRGLGVLTEGFVPRCNSKLARNMQSRSLNRFLGYLEAQFHLKSRLVTMGECGSPPRPVNKLFLLSRLCPVAFIRVHRVRWRMIIHREH